MLGVEHDWSITILYLSDNSVNNDSWRAVVQLSYLVDVSQSGQEVAGDFPQSIV